MYKFLTLIVFTILVSCNSQKKPDENNRIAQNKAEALKDSAIKMMSDPTDNEKFEESIELLNAALSKDPKLKSAYFYKMKYYTEKGDDENAFRTLLALNKVNPGDAFSTLNIGIEYEKRDSLQKAQAKYTEAVSLFENALDTISETNALVRNTFIMNLALANTLARDDSGMEDFRSELSKPEAENLDIALHTLKGMTRDDLLNIHKSQAGRKRAATDH